MVSKLIGKTTTAITRKTIADSLRAKRIAGTNATLLSSLHLERPKSLSNGVKILDALFPDKLCGRESSDVSGLLKKPLLKERNFCLRLLEKRNPLKSGLKTRDAKLFIKLFTQGSREME